MLRGGAWNNTRDNARAVYRNNNEPDNRNNNNGFRLVAPHASRYPAGNAARRRLGGRGRERWRAQALAGGFRTCRANTEPARAFQ